MMGDFAGRVTTALRAVPHRLECERYVEAYGEPFPTGSEALAELNEVRDACICDREDRQGALVARAIEQARAYALENTSGAVWDRAMAVALRVLTGDAAKEDVSP